MLYPSKHMHYPQRGEEPRGSLGTATTHHLHGAGDMGKRQAMCRDWLCASVGCCFPHSWRFCTVISKLFVFEPRAIAIPGGSMRESSWYW